jgi:hypothetical protein
MSDQSQPLIDSKAIEPGTWSVPVIGGITLPVHGIGEVPVITQIDDKELSYCWCVGRGKDRSQLILD